MVNQFIFLWIRGSVKVLNDIKLDEPFDHLFKLLVPYSTNKKLAEHFLINGILEQF